MPRSAWIDSDRFVLLAILLFAGTALIQSATRPIVDWDEAVYVHLSERMTWTAGNYTTRGSAVDLSLPQPVYRSPLFHHPPLIPLLIKAFSTFLPPVGAARLLIALFHALLLWSVFAVARRLSNDLGGVIALVLASFCPIINLQARLIHIDLPMTAFVLLGTVLCLPAGGAGPPSNWRLAASGAMFAAGFLSKFEAPLFVPIPVILFLVQRPWRLGRALSFFVPLAVGFLWWAVIIWRFGTLVPREFHLSGIAPFNPYLLGIARRSWWHLPVYFLAICPLAGVYAVQIARGAVRFMRRRLPQSETQLAALNSAAWISAAVLGMVIGTGSAYWSFRYFLPVVAIIYISLGCLTASILLRGERVWNSYLAALMVFTAFTMCWSAASSVNLPGNLKTIPVPLFWFGLGRLFL